MLLDADSDLSNLMMQIRKLAESKREIESLIYATNEINSLVKLLFCIYHCSVHYLLTFSSYLKSRVKD